MTVSTVFFVLVVTNLGSTSPVPHEIYDINADQHQMEVPQLGVSVPRVVFLLPYFGGNITKSLVPEFRNRQWSTLNGPQKVVVCHGEDGRQFDGFPCDDNVCVPLHWVCDRDTDCEGGEDEVECGSCEEDELFCIVQGVRTCLAAHFLCDGRRDCSDGSDEDPNNCRSSCEFHCRDGSDCIAGKLVCDGDYDCSDGSDEYDCDHHLSHSDCHPEFEFQCYDSLTEEEWQYCVPKVWLCDDHDDCPHGEDEYISTCVRKGTYNYVQ